MSNVDRTKPLLEVEGLKKYFATKRGMLHAVDDVTFTINQGMTLGVFVCLNPPPAKSTSTDRTSSP